MTLIDFYTLLVAAISLIISLWAAFRTNQIANDEIRLSRRTELHTLLQAIEQVLIDKPELALIFNSEKDHQSRFEEPSIPVQEAYVFMHLNLFELAFSLFRETRKLSNNET